MTQNALTEWARLLLGSLAQAGLRDVVVSPGSRSTPFTWAALHTPGLACRSVVDERSAGFFALGQTRVTGRPTALLCTSGSAAAQYFPAVVEASHAQLPLIVITADRPFDVQAVGAAQTMNQTQLYGAFARGYFELGHPESTAAALDGLRRMAAHAFELSRGPLPGPVQLNARARKPLEPRAASNDQERAVTLAVDARLARPLTEHASANAQPALPSSLLQAVHTVRSGLIVCGPLPAWGVAPEALFELAKKTGFPLCVEATSQLRFDLPEPCPADLHVSGAFDALLAQRRPELMPELVLRFGAPATSSAFERVAGEAELLQAVVTEQGWLDPSNRARWLLQAEPLGVARALCQALDAVTAPVARSEFAARFMDAERRYWSLLAAEPGSKNGAALSEPELTARAIELLPPGALLALGNSLPLRDVDAFARPRSARLRVVSQRGVNGIDGLVSGAVGSALAARVPSLLLLGDVSLLHDVGGLALGRELDSPLVVLVIDNAGGRIFDDLPFGSRLVEQPELGRFWRTPREFDFRHAAELFGCRSARVTRLDEVEPAFSEAFAFPGLTLLHALVVPESSRTLRQKLQQQLVPSA